MVLASISNLNETCDRDGYDGNCVSEYLIHVRCNQNYYDEDQADEEQDHDQDSRGR